MKKFTRFWLAGLMLLGFSACSDEQLPGEVDNNNPNTADAVYMQFKLGLPVGPDGRSSTKPEGGSDAGVEVGSDAENTVKKILIVITDTNNGYITHSVANNDQFSSSNDRKTYVVPFSSTALTAKAGHNVNIYVYCNPTEALVNSATSTMFNVNLKYTITGTTDTTPWNTTTGFFMSNADENYTRTMPGSFAEYKVESNPYPLGTINVERSVARFDYKSGGANGDDIYTLMEDGSGNAQVQLQLTHMALVNMSKEFYYLRRVSADGTDNGAVIGGLEVGNSAIGATPTVKANYVVDTDYTWKSSYVSTTTTDKNEHFLYDSDSEVTATDWKALPMSESDPNDNEDTWNTGKTDQGYKIWRYVTENTIPGDISNQKHGITTGVAFKGKLIVNESWTEESALKDAIKEGTQPLFVYGDVMYGTWEKVKEAAEKKEGDSPVNPSLNLAYNAIVKDISGTVDVNNEEFLNKAKANNFTVFKPTPSTETGKPGVYEVLYYYWNRHNDNGNNGLMGPMEFAVVRNNVYKLSVTKVNKFGHPALGVDPEDPTNPDDPDEDDNVYFEVAVQVLPWVVRLNNIEF